MANTIRDLLGLKYVEMQGARFARKPVPAVFDGGAWTKIRVALWWKSEVGYSTTPTGTPRFRVGLCSGTTNIPGDATPTNAIGFVSTAASWTGYNTGANTIVHYFTCAPFTNVAGVETIGANASANVGIPAVENSQDGGMFFVDITKGSPNFTVQLIARKALASSTEDNTTFEAQSILGLPNVGSVALCTAQTIAFSQSNGTLDAAFVYWDPTFLCRLKHWRVIRLG